MKKRVVCSGTFDKPHTGHKKYFEESKKLLPNAELIVIIATDKNSERIKNKKPTNTQEKRLRKIKELEVVNEAVLGYEGKNSIERIISLKPDLIALGHDQWAKKEWLKKELEKKNCKPRIVRMPKYQKKYL